MLLALDIGNSNIKIGIGDEEGWRSHQRFPTHPAHKSRFYKSLIQQVLQKAEVPSKDIHQAVVGSVVPPVAKPLIKALTKILKVSPLQVDGTLATGLALQTQSAAQVGADLIAGAVAAYHLMDHACLIVDCGTATTVMVVDNSPALQGGAICAGLKASVQALVGDTAQLPDIPLEIPASPVGKNTVSCMQSGVVMGHLCMIEGLIDRIKKQMGPVKVVATGGLISLLAPHTTYFDAVEPTLVLDGLRLIAERQQ